MSRSLIRTKKNFIRRLFWLKLYRRLYSSRPSASAGPSTSYRSSTSAGPSTSSRASTSAGPSTSSRPSTSARALTSTRPLTSRRGSLVSDFDRNHSYARPVRDLIYGRDRSRSPPRRNRGGWHPHHRSPSGLNDLVVSLQREVAALRNQHNQFYGMLVIFWHNTLFLLFFFFINLSIFCIIFRSSSSRLRR